MEKTIAVELKEIKKYFGPVRANDGVDLKAYSGEIHAILGENGSGKSTLMNILSGLYAMDSGEIHLDGAPVTLHSPKDAIEKGIGMIHQHFKLVDAFSAWENIIGGMRGNVFFKKKAIISKINNLCEKYKFQMDPEKKVGDMTIGEKQTVEIVKALYRGARIMILDEPTAVLAKQEIENLFGILREMKADGCAVVIITHKLQEVMDISDRVTVLRKGVSVCSMETADCTPQQMAEMMVGRAVDIHIPYEYIPEEKKKPVVSIRNLRVAGAGGKERLNIPKLDICSFEILGVAGVADSGQKELCEAIAGIQKASGSVTFKGRELIGMNPRTMLKEGINIGYVPEDRLGMGLANGLNISDNVALRSYRSVKGQVLNKKEDDRKARDLIERYDVSASGVHQAIQSLSGGNIQKILLGREIDRDTEFFIAAYPVRGLDIGASDFIYEQVNKAKKKGVAILFVGEDLDMLLGICDRIAVLHGGQLMDVVDAKTISRENLGLLMMGKKPEDTAYV